MCSSDLELDEQLLNGGWIIGLDLVAIKVSSSNGARSLYTPVNEEPISLRSYVGSRIQSLTPASRVDIEANRAIQVSGKVEIFGAESTANIRTATSLTVMEGGLIAGRDNGDVLTLTAGTVLAIQPGGAVTAGARFDDANGTPVAVQTGTGADAILNSAHELFIGGSVTTSDAMVLNSGPPLLDHSDYFDALALVDANQIGRAHV